MNEEQKETPQLTNNEFPKRTLRQRKRQARFLASAMSNHNDITSVQPHEQTRSPVPTSETLSTDTIVVNAPLGISSSDTIVAQNKTQTINAKKRGNLGSLGGQTSRQRTARASLSTDPNYMDDQPAEYDVPPCLPTVHTTHQISDTTVLKNLEPVSMYRSHGDCDQICECCGALFWFSERQSGLPSNVRPRYGMCCKAGKVALAYPNCVPLELKALFLDNDFMLNIRAYNSMFAMTSFGASIDNTINNGRGPYVFKVSGRVSHWVGSICPPPNHAPRFMQIYVYDTDNEVANRMRPFDKSTTTGLSEAIVERLIKILDQHNALVQLMRTARDVCKTQDVPDFNIQLYRNVGKPSFDIPRAGTLGAIISDSSTDGIDFDVIVRNKAGDPHRINSLHPSYMSLQYPLLFPYGERGWSIDLRLRPSPLAPKNNRTKPVATKLSMNMYYTYQIHQRSSVETLLFHGGRLFQQYLVDAYICVEQNRLEYIRKHQNDIRSDVLDGIHDAVSKGDTIGKSIGKRIILPSSFTGSPRYMYSHYQDALAICRVHGNPQYFITFTCNSNWPEIKSYITSNCIGTRTPQDRPDIIARVFRMKVDSFIKFLETEHPFGQVAAVLYTIEFQKRGLPHCHTLLWVTPPFKIHDPKDIDKYISAEIPNPDKDPELFKIVTDCMVHGPCGLLNKNSPCMKENKCSKGYPKKFETHTRLDKHGYVFYKRSGDSSSILKNDVPIDNGFVVPYNPTLSKVFNAHINVEYCGWSMLIKYLFKYISKGVDRVSYKITKKNSAIGMNPQVATPVVNEIDNFVEGRFICPHEASWRLLNYPIHHRKPAVQILSVHLEGKHTVTFKSQSRLHDVLKNPNSKKSTLTAWFHSNTVDPTGRHLTYPNYPSTYRWLASGKEWIRRTSRRTPAIGRLIYIHPSSGEVFYMRKLLTVQQGCTSFDSLKTVNNTTHSTYRDACDALGMLGEDVEWQETLSDAANHATSKEMRSLFTHILLFCNLSSPKNLWAKNWRSMSDDIVWKLKGESLHGECNLPDEDIQQQVLYELEILLNSSVGSPSLKTYGLPMPSAALLELLQNRLLMEERNYDRNELRVLHESLFPHLNTEQSSIYQVTTDAVHNGKQALLFVYGHGGTGKTYLWRTILYGLRAAGKIVLAVAASGIASLLLPSGRTAHSRFKIPISLNDESLCHIKKNTQLSKLLAETSLIIWDEAPMSDRRCFEALDRTLRDLLERSDQPFGGISVLLGGDFRQTLPVKPGGSKPSVINACITKSPLWAHFQLMHLSINMRLSQSSLSTLDNNKTQQFSKWLLNVGDGVIGEGLDNANTDYKRITIPDENLIVKEEAPLKELIDFIYDINTLQYPTPKNLSDRAIVCPTNTTCDSINKTILNLTPHPTTSYFSADTACSPNGMPHDTDSLYPSEYLNMLNFSGIPPHQLDFKEGCPVMLLRNINQAAGLCNGTRLLITRLLPKVIEARIITGNCVGDRVYIPRIIFVHKDEKLPFVFNRRQFPIKCCYAMTINKSQGQSLNRIGIHLPQPVFGHGQLYVALSRATSPSSLKVLITDDEGLCCKATTNVVYTDFLNQI